MRAVPGDFGEVGVWKGAASRKLLRMASGMGKRLYLFDSFQGMAKPGSHDSHAHPEREFDVGGVEGFKKIMRSHGVPDTAYTTCDGFIPNCFDRVDGHSRFAFMLIDVDNYMPTKQTLEWAWPRLEKGGVLALDDFYPAGELDATKAIKEFLRDNRDYYILDYFNYQLILRKDGE